jgi:hypothetical protein
LYNFTNTGASDQTIGVHAPSPAAYLRNDITGLYFPGLSNASYQNAPSAWNDVPLTISGTQYTNNTASVQAITSSTPIATLNVLPDSFILELTQDISTSATIAQKATVNVYFTQDSEQGWVAFLSRVLQPQGEPQPTVLTSSFPLVNDDGGIGDPTSPSSTAGAMGGLFQALGALGIQLFSAVGDWGSNDNINDGGLHVGYPHSDPAVTACGGTVLSDSPSFLEYVWSDAFNTTSPFGGGSPATSFGTTGGGFSKTFTTAPAYQTGAISTAATTDSAEKVHTGRGVPDIAGMVAYNGFFVNGVSYPYTGTSCVAPLYAGLAAVLRSAFGRSLGPLNTLFYQVPSAFNDVTHGDNDSADKTNDSPYFTAGAGWDACTGLGSIDGAKMVNAIAGLLYSPNWYFQVNKGSYGLDEVRITSQYSQSLWLALEGYTPNQVTTANLQPTVTVIGGGISVTVNPPQFELANNLDTPQRILFPCSITFLAPIGTVSQNGIFPDVGQPATQALLGSVIQFQGSRLTAETTFQLEAGADPFFSNYNTSGAGVDGQGFNVFYLSQDLRVFIVTPGINASPIDGISLNVPDFTNYHSQQAYTYITTLLGHLNSTYNDGSTDPFTLFPDQTNAASGDSSVLPTTPGPNNQTFVNYNFAVARVRLTDANKASTGGPVKVFFRLFATETSDTDYQPAVTYPSNFVNGLPESPLPGLANVTLPFFATGNYDTSPVNVDYSAPSVNNQPIVVQSGTQAWAYYGCYLNLYASDARIGGTHIQKLLPSSHSCLVAQIAYDNAPIPTGGSQVASPENSDKLAQRNLQITYSDNPGPAEAHRVPQTFDLRPSAALGTGGGLLDYPDELMIDWGKTPPGSIASIYWPAVAATDVLGLAGKLYSTHQLSAADAYTIRCTVPSGLTFVPIPPGIGENIAGLFTVELPQGVLAGQTFVITVRRISTQRGAAQPPPPPPIAGHARSVASPRIAVASAATTTNNLTNVNWRYVVGTFAVRIPVTTAKVMRPVEENTLAIMRWRLHEMSHSNRWHPVLLRYISLLEGRVRGVFGNPATIVPSQWGIWGTPGLGKGGQPQKPLCEHIGKVEGLIFDRFGDFEGFLLRDECGEEHCFRSRESEIEALVRFAWEKRVVISVLTEEDKPEIPTKIILRRAPRQPRRWEA